MPRLSAGVLLYRRTPDLQVLLVHPGGPFWVRKDEGAWSIPKGEVSPEEDLLQAARREFEEETGVAIDGAFEALTPVRQTGGKVVAAVAVEGDLDADAIVSNTFEIEWPPRSGRKAEFPEVDRAAWFSLDEAHVRIVSGQRPLLDELAALLSTH